MECSICGSPSAQLRTHSADGTKNQVCLCDACYKKLYTKSDGSELFAHLFGSRGAKAEKRKVCSSCGMTLESFQKSGLLGCAQCYTAFRDEINHSIRYCQRSNQHCGRKPIVSSDLKYELVREQESFRSQLNVARREGDFALEEELSRRLEELQKMIVRAEAVQERLRAEAEKRLHTEEED